MAQGSRCLSKDSFHFDRCTNLCNIRPELNVYSFFLIIQFIQLNLMRKIGEILNAPHLRMMMMMGNRCKLKMKRLQLLPQLPADRQPLHLVQLKGLPCYKVFPDK